MKSCDIFLEPDRFKLITCRDSTHPGRVKFRAIKPIRMVNKTCLQNKQTLKLGELISGINAVNLSLSCFLQVALLLKVTKTNLVVTKLAAGGHKQDSKVRV